MMNTSEFLFLLPVQKALSLLFSHLSDFDPRTVEVSSKDSVGCIVAHDIRAPHSLPSFPRSTVDGYALVASDTYGASESMPAYLNLAGEVPMGGESNIKLASGQAAAIHTGGMIPVNADSVIMIEDTQSIGEGEIEIRKAIAVAENVLGVGEDIKEGELVVSAGTKLRSADVGGLMALGIMGIRVNSKPSVGIISSGDEIVRPDQELELGQVRDVNSYMLSSLITRWGAESIFYGIVPDNLEKLIEVAKQAHKACDMVIFTAGSSVSVRDTTSAAIGILGNPGLLVHGVNIRPGKPTILAVCSGKPVIGLPGNPVSAYITANLFIAPVIKYLLGVKEKELLPAIRAELSTNIPSQSGREDWIPIKLSRMETRIVATPIFAKSNYIFSLVHSDGLVRIEKDQTGMEAGDIVDVYQCD